MELPTRLPPVRCPRDEQGAALLVVMCVMLAVLVGGLAAVAVTSGELGGAGGYRTRQTTEACAAAGLEKMRSLMPAATFADSEGSVNAGVTLSYKAGHFDGPKGSEPFVVLDVSQYDAAALYAGQNITNMLGKAAGGDLRNSLNLISTTAVCEGVGHGKREMQLVFRYGTPAGMR